MMKDLLITLLTAMGIFLAGFLLLLLLVPIHLQAVGRLKDEMAYGWLKVSWGWNFLAVQLSSWRKIKISLLGFSFRQRSLPQRAVRETSTKPQQKKKTRDRIHLASVFNHRKAIFRIIGRLLHTLRLRFKIDGTVGFRNPVHFIVARKLLTRFDHLAPWLSLNIQHPDANEVISLEAKLQIRAWPIHLIAVSIGLLLGDKEVRQALQVMF